MLIYDNNKALTGVTSKSEIRLALPDHDGCLIYRAVFRVLWYESLGQGSNPTHWYLWGCFPRLNKPLSHSLTLPNHRLMFLWLSTHDWIAPVQLYHLHCFSNYLVFFACWQTYILLVQKLHILNNIDHWLIRCRLWQDVVWSQSARGTCTSIRVTAPRRTDDGPLPAQITTSITAVQNEKVHNASATHYITRFSVIR